MVNIWNLSDILNNIEFKDSFTLLKVNEEELIKPLLKENKVEYSFLMAKTNYITKMIFFKAFGMINVIIENPKATDDILSNQ